MGPIFRACDVIGYRPPLRWTHESAEYGLNSLPWAPRAWPRYNRLSITDRRVEVGKFRPHSERAITPCFVISRSAVQARAPAPISKNPRHIKTITLSVRLAVRARHLVPPDHDDSAIAVVPRPLGRRSCYRCLEM